MMANMSGGAVDLVDKNLIFLLKVVEVQGIDYVGFIKKSINK